MRALRRGYFGVPSRSPERLVFSFKRAGGRALRRPDLFRGLGRAPGATRSCAAPERLCDRESSERGSSSRRAQSLDPLEISLSKDSRAWTPYESLGRFRSPRVTTIDSVPSCHGDRTFVRSSSSTGSHRTRLTHAPQKNNGVFNATK